MGLLYKYIARKFSDRRIKKKNDEFPFFIE